MQKDAEAHSDEDKKKRKLAEKRNEADTLIYSVEKSLGDYGDKITAEEKQAISEALEKTRKVKDSTEDPEELQKAVTELSTASHKLAEHMYKASQEGAQQAGERASGGAAEGEKTEKEDVVEAEFEESDKDKKE